jgi:hypothetical protein
MDMMVCSREATTVELPPTDHDVGVRFTWGTNVFSWLSGQVLFSPNELAHGQPPLAATDFTFALDASPNTWHLVGLYGCSSVIVISRKRMFMTHIWEGPTF